MLLILSGAPPSAYSLGFIGLGVDTRQILSLLRVLIIDIEPCKVFMLDAIFLKIKRYSKIMIVVAEG